ncbi:MAG: DivIVA domain-containing protein [Solirubrobacteraceae bacterium]
MPDQSSAANEHAILQEITAPLETLPDDPVAVVVNADFPNALRGYDRIAVDAYVRRTSQLVAELHATRSPEAAVRRALERVGEQISGILQRAHETAEQITEQSRAEAEDRLEAARAEAAEIIVGAQQRVKDLDADTDRIWIERGRIVDDARELAAQLLAVADGASDRFPEVESEPHPVVGESGLDPPAGEAELDRLAGEAELDRLADEAELDPLADEAELDPVGGEPEPPRADYGDAGEDEELELPYAEDQNETELYDAENPAETKLEADEPDATVRYEPPPDDVEATRRFAPLPERDDPLPPEPSADPARPPGSASPPPDATTSPSEGANPPSEGENPPPVRGTRSVIPPASQAAADRRASR